MTEVSEEGERWKIYKGDALVVLPALERNISLIVTDPPYGVRYSSGWSGKVSGRQIAGDNDASFVYDILRDALRLYGGADEHMYVFGDFDLTSLPSIKGQTELVWDKARPGMGDLSNPWANSYEHIQFARARASREAPSFLRKRKLAVLRCYNISGQASKRHPTEKPVPLLRDLIESSSKFDDVVLDPFMGVGSTGVAALLEGRRFVGVELEPDYFSIAAERLREAEKAWANQAGI